MGYLYSKFPLWEVYRLIYGWKFSLMMTDYWLLLTCGRLEAPVLGGFVNWVPNCELLVAGLKSV